mmetsp:Transcript_23145/g.67469  ORF Transcript_23145/g.67469 Transcript_23145/m.67469 type:complete len:253 (-) Transcript_23145:634-1392(-)|eukprot:CAMPEP_0118969040 /NCGR_PEP_ID=MMETSP1173-20130426/6185_1 /TAXON_ID=1034831 /ORGANISM="Rhizochromulina marina cf, Strain CCMP1243" /LENGTH=252 /DNA_ID=CAMNT_0006918233 /DNA_START=36 /DNA_END=794 /DNA_ORIENTATION=-
MAALEPGSELEVPEVPEEFGTEEEEAAFLDKYSKIRQSVAQERRQSTITLGALPLEHVSFIKLNPEAEDSGPKLATMAGRILRTVDRGVLGASMRPTDTEGFDWVFKVQFKSGEELEMFYEQLDLQNDDGLIVDNVMVALPRLEGMVTPGTFEVTTLVAAKTGASVTDLLQAAQATNPPGLIKSSLRQIPVQDAFFEGYASAAPGYTHVLMMNFDAGQGATDFAKGGALAAALGGTEGVATDPAPLTFQYGF